MKKINLSIAFHLNDAPYLKSHEIERMTKTFFGNILELMEETALDKVNIYLSGRFLEALRKVNGAILAGVLDRTKSGQMEWLGGGFYDPVFPIIPKESQDLQIKKHLELVDKILGVRPRGFVLPSYVWETECIDLLSRNGFEFTCLKQYQLQDSLWRYGTDKGFWTLEDRGQVVKVLSSSQQLARHFVDGQYKRFVDHLDEMADATSFAQLDLPFLRQKKGRFEESWFDHLKKLLKRIKQSELELSFKTLSSHLDEQISGGAIHLLPSVGKSLGLKEHQATCRDLLILQPECNFIHKKMIHLHREINRFENQKIKQELMELLLPTQSLYYYRNSAKAGGVRHLEDRQDIHTRLIHIEDKLRRYSEVEGVQVEIVDFFGNGSKEVMLGNDKLGVVVEHRRGGVLRSFDYRPARLNLINSYMQSEKQTGKGPIYQVFPMVGLRDVLCTEEELDLISIPDWIHDDSHILSQAMDYQLKPRQDSTQLLLSGDQRITLDSVEQIMHMEKVYTMKSKEAELVWTQQLKNGSFREFNGYFGTLFNLSSGLLEMKNGSLSTQDQSIDFTQDQFVDEVEEITWKDKEHGVKFKWEFKKPCKLYIRCILDYDVGDTFEQQFQGIQILPLWKCHLLGQEKLSLMSKLSLQKIGFIFR